MQIRSVLLSIWAAGCLQADLQAQTYTDNFDFYHDYSLGDVTGTMWDGVLNVGNLDPGSDTTGGVLHWRNTGEGFENSEADAPMLYKTVPGDFDAEVYMPFIANVTWSDGGIIARLPDNSAGENYVTVKAFAPGGADGVRWAVNGAGTTVATISPLRPYVRLQRRGTTFKFSTKATEGAPWALGYTLNQPNMVGSLQVGLWHGTFTGNTGNAADREFDNFSLTLVTGPKITAQPAGTKAMVGGSATFTVSATGIDPLEYQWRLNGTNILNAISASYNIPAVAATDVGKYSVVVTDADGSTTSDDALLEVFVSGELFGDNFDTYHDYSSGDVTGTIWDGVLNAGNLDPGSDTIGGVLHWRNTGEGWEGATASSPVLYKTVPGDFDAEVYMPFISNVQWSDGGIIARLPDASAGENFVTVKAFGTGGEDDARWSVNGVGSNQRLSALQPYVRLQRRGTTFKFSTKAAAGDAWTLGYTLARPDMAGVLQVGLWHGTFVGNAADRQFDNFWLRELVGPIITAQPGPSQSVSVGTNLSFSVTATGVEPLEYQWQHAGTNLPDATGATLTLSNVQRTDAGTYMVVVTDADGITESETVTLTVYASLGVVADNFDRYHDYTTGDVSGTIWDGVLNAQNLDPGSDTTDGVLHWRNTGEGFENNNGSAPVLYKVMSGDFDAEVYMPSIANVTWSDGGIIARLPDNTEGENYVTVKAFAPGSADGARWAVNGVGNGLNIAPLQPYVRLQRSGTAFNFYSKASAEDAWTLGYTMDRPDMAGSLQVGLWHGTFDPNSPADRQFDNFRLSGPGLVGAVSISRAGDQIVLSWEGANLILQQNSNLANPTGWTDVPEVTGNSTSLPLWPGNMFFRLRTP